MSRLKSYWYDEQLKRYLVQFAAIFAGMNVSVGKRDDVEEHLIRVPIYAASKDRVVAAIKSENTQNKPLRIPAMNVAIVGYDLAPERRKGVPNTRRNTFMPTGGVFPDDISVSEQRMPVPYNLTMELSVWASNQDQHYQILEQILMLFNPILQIQTSDDMLDWSQITTVELTAIRPEENIPAGTDRRIIQTTLEFVVPVYIQVPTVVHDKFVRDIYLRVGTVSSAAESSYDIVGELDSQGIPYELLFSLSDVDLTDT